MKKKGLFDDFKYQKMLSIGLTFKSNYNLTDAVIPYKH